MVSPTIRAGKESPRHAAPRPRRSPRTRARSVTRNVTLAPSRNWRRRFNSDRSDVSQTFPRCGLGG
jgi:hypothetical protein